MKTPVLRRLPIPAALASFLAPGLALATPTGGTVVGGNATISNPGANGTIVTETSNSAAINWQTFNIGSGQYVRFVQPSSSSVVLNRVVGGSPSEIFGSLQANGRVFLINPYGVLFGPGASVDVGGLVASTLNISNEDFLSGRYVFTGAGVSGATVSNAGTITAAPGGFVVLSGDIVRNTGLVQAQLGQVVLASGSAMTMDLDGSGLVSVAVNQAALSQQAGVDNAGELLADGGKVVMTARTARGLVGSAVNNTGLVRAEGIAEHDGQIELTASGGNITDSGTLDAGNAGGTGGTVEVTGDQNIDLENGAQILVSGAQGGQVHLVANGTLDTRAGSTIQALGSAGPGGFAELSGHGKLSMRGAVNLGRGGTLLIDPTNIEIRAGAPCDCSSTSGTVYQSTLESELKAGTNMQLIASNGITLDKLGTTSSHGVYTPGSLNGANSGNGGSLLLGIGTATTGIGANDGTYQQGAGGSITFQSPKDSIVTDGGISVYSGTGTGTIGVGNLTSNVGGIDLNAGGAISAGNLSAGGPITNAMPAIRLQSTTAGDITVGSISATSGSVNASAAAGNVTVTGDVNVTTHGGLAALNVTADGGNIQLEGAVNISGGGGNSDSAGLHSGAPSSFSCGRGCVRPEEPMAVMNLTATQSDGGANGDITVAGPVSVTAQGYTSRIGSVSRTEGGAQLNVTGGNVTFNNTVNLSGVGSASFEINAGKSITLQKAVTVSATRGSSSGQIFGGDNSTVAQNKTGLAAIDLGASSNGIVYTPKITTASLSAQGPLAVVSVAGGQLNLGAISVNAGHGATANAGSGGYYHSSSTDGASVVTSNYGQGVVQLLSDGAAGATTITAGPISISGPTAELQVQTHGNVQINGGITVQGLGYTISGDATQLPALSAVGASSFFANRSPLLPPVELNSGTTTWGAGVAVINGGYPPTDSLDRGQGRSTLRPIVNGALGPTSSSGAFAAGQVNISGPVDISGVGRAGLRVYAGSLSVAGGVSVTATQGTLHGIQTSTIYTGSSDCSDCTLRYTATRSFSNGAGGAATAGLAEARILIAGSTGNVALGALTVQGLTANAKIEGGDNVSITGNAVVAGDYGGVVPVLDDAVSFTALNEGAPSIVSADSHIVGGVNGLQVGLGTPPGAFTAGGIQVSGSGFVGLGIDAGSINAGAVQINQLGGSLVSNDPTLTATPYDFTNPGAALYLNGGTSLANAQSISVTAVGPLMLGLDANVTGAFKVSAQSLTTTLPGAVDYFTSPLNVGTPNGLDSASTPAGLTGTALSVNAGSIDLSFTANSSLPVLDLTASGALSINGGKTQLSVSSGTVTLSGGSVNLSSVELLAPGTLDVTATGTGALSVDQAILTAPTGLTLTSAGDENITNSTLQDSSATVGAVLKAGGKLALTGSSIDADSQTLSAGGDLTVSSSTLQGGLTSPDSLALNGGSVGITGSTLTADSITIGTTDSGGSLAIKSSGLDARLQSLTASSQLALTSDSFAGASGAGGAGIQSLAILSDGEASLLNVNLNSGTQGSIESKTGGLTLTNVHDTKWTELKIEGDAGTATVANSNLFATTMTVQGAGASVTGTKLNAPTLTIESQSGPASVAGSALIATDLTIESQSGAASVAGSTLNATDLSIESQSGAASVTDSTLTASQLTVQAGTGVTLASDTITAPTIDLVGGAGATTIGFDLTGTTLKISGASVSADGLSGKDVNVTGTAGGITVSGATSATTASFSAAGGGLTTGAINATTLNATVSGGSAQIASIDVAGAVSLDVSGGNLQTGDITANQLTADVGTGNITVGTVGITGASLPTFGMGDVPGQTLSIGGLNLVYSGPIVFQYQNVSMNLGALDVPGGLTVDLTNGSLNTAGVTTPANVSLSTVKGALDITGNISAANLTLAAGGNLNVNQAKLTASSALTVNAGVLDASGASLSAPTVTLDTGSFSLDNSTVTGGTVSLSFSADSATPNLDLSATDALSIDGNGHNVTVSTGPVTLNGASISLSSFSLATPAAVSLDASGTGDTALSLDKVSVSTPGALTLTSAGGISIDDSQLGGSGAAVASGAISGKADTAGAIALNAGGPVQLNGASLSGGDVQIQANGAVGATGTASTINANALSVTASSIDLSDAALTIGNGTAAFGADPALLQALATQAPTLSPSASSPNASFNAAGGVTLGQMSVAGGYVFIQAPTLNLPTVTGGPGLFVDFLPSTPTATLNLSPSQPPAGIATIVFGGSSQTGTINIGNGNQLFVFTGNSNFVFDSAGTTYYPDRISTNGRVVVLGAEVLASLPFNSTDLPLSPTDLNPDQPPPSVLDPNTDPGNVNADGVNSANQGLIDIDGSGPLSCSVGTTQ